MTRIVCISDTHNKHGKITLPQGDVLIHSGDLTVSGSEDETVDGLEWLQDQISKFKYVIYVEGNHDWFGYAHPSLFEEIRSRVAPDVIHLRESSIEIENIKIYGFPFIPTLTNWAFYLSPDDMKKAVEKIPENTNLLISHAPPYEILDGVPRTAMFGERYVAHVGCPQLANRLTQFKELKLHVFGHIHEDFGRRIIGNMEFVNCSQLDGRYTLKNYPIVTEI